MNRKNLYKNTQKNKFTFLALFLLLIASETSFLLWARSASEASVWIAVVCFIYLKCLICLGASYNAVIIVKLEMKYNKIGMKYNKIGMKYNKIGMKYNKIGMKYNKILKFIVFHI